MTLTLPACSSPFYLLLRKSVLQKYYYFRMEKTTGVLPHKCYSLMDRDCYNSARGCAPYWKIYNSKIKYAEL